MADILSLETPYQDQDTVTSTNLNDLVKKATLTSAAVDGATTQLSSGAIIVRDGGITEQKLSTTAQAKLLQGPEIAAAASNSEAFVGGTKAGDTRGTFSLDIQNKQSSAATTKVASGDSAVAFGFENTAAGTYCTSIGQENLVDSGAQYSTAIGQSNTYSSDPNDFNLYSSAVGYNNTITNGKQCVALGLNNSTSDKDCIAIGDGNSASGFGAITFGRDNSSTSGGYGIAMGISNTADGSSVSVGKSNTSTDSGIAVGINCTANNSSVALGNDCDVGSPTGIAIGSGAKCDQISCFAIGQSSKVLTGSDISTFEIGNGRTNALRGHPDGQIALTLNNSSSAPTDGGSTNFAEANSTLPRSMFSIQRDGDAFTLYFNDAGTVKSLSLGNVS